MREKINNLVINARLHFDNTTIKLLCMAGALVPSVVPTITSGADLVSDINGVAQKFYTFILAITSAVAFVALAVCIFQMMYSKSEKVVSEATSWLKRIIVGWIAMALLGGAVTLMTGWFKYADSGELNITGGGLENSTSKE